ncbi:Bestrophin 1 [Carabus blaptoides fortunei]
MTVTYTGEVATCRGLGCFLKLLLRWKGSIYKLVWMDLLLFLSLYYFLNIMYRYWLDDGGKRVFESIVSYCTLYSDYIPLSFVLGFYVSIVMTRWWNQYTAIPFPDPLAVYVSANVHGQDERGRVMRRTVMRYVCLCVTMMFTMISPRVKKRFPTLDHFVDAGLLQSSEKVIIEDLNNKFPKHSKHWLPIVWAASIITRARKEGRIRDDFAVKTIIDELNKFRGQCGLLISYDAISVPLVYTQVVTLAVYSYFLTTLMGHQWVAAKEVTANNSKIDLYFPVFTTLQFFFYIGWLKVAETLINPFGDDDDDFEVNWMVDRNLQVSYLIVDEMHHEHPELVRDQYWDEVFPSELPYTLASEPFREEHPLPSTANIAVKTDEEILSPSSMRIGDLQDAPISYDDAQSAIHFTAKPTGIHTRTSSVGSQSSMNTTMGSLPRVNSVTNVLRRLFSRENSRTDGETIPMSHSATNLQPRNFGGSMRITDQVIEEVDEQLTHTSQMKSPDNRPSVMHIFGPPPASNPVDVPKSKASSVKSVSAPASRVRSPSMESASPDVRPASDTLSIGGSSTDSGDDEFARLREIREQERQKKLLEKLSRSLSNQPTDAANPETESLLGDRATVINVVPVRVNMDDL